MNKDTPSELIHGESQGIPILIASLPASVQQRRIAFGVVFFFSVVFAIGMPFATVQIAHIDSFIPVTQSIVLFADLITAVFLFAQFSIQPQRALLALGSGYVFSGLFAFLQALDFPGAFSATGLISGTPSGAVWLFSFWRIMFPLAVIAYVLLKDANESASQIIELDPGRVIAITVACVLAATAGLTWLVAVGHLPTLYIDATRQTLVVQYFAGAMWLLNAVAIVLLFVRRRTILDVWLIVAVFVAIPDLGLSSVFPVVRFSVGWYIAKVYILIASSTVLGVLLWETTLLYARLTYTVRLLRRERSNRLMTLDAATASMAHELRQPLTVIASRSRAASNWIKRTPPEVDEVQACLAAISDSSTRADEIISGVRDLFKKSDKHRTMIHVDDVARQVLSLVRPELLLNQVSVATEFQNDLPEVHADRTLISASHFELGKKCNRRNGLNACAREASSLGDECQRTFVHFAVRSGHRTWDRKARTRIRAVLHDKTHRHGIGTFHLSDCRSGPRRQFETCQVKL